MYFTQKLKLQDCEVFICERYQINRKRNFILTVENDVNGDETDFGVWFENDPRFARRQMLLHLRNPA